MNYEYYEQKNLNTADIFFFHILAILNDWEHYETVENVSFRLKTVPSQHIEGFLVWL